MPGPAENIASSTLSDAELHKILHTWNDTRVDYPTHLPLNRFLEDQAGRTPDAIALVYESQQLTYRELNERANRIANFLRRQGVGPDVLVGVCAERSIEMVLALVGVVKAGGAYVPLDPDYPKDRLAAMLEDAAPPVVLTQAHLLDRVPKSMAQVVCLDRDSEVFAREEKEDLPVLANGKNLAYAIYTSGSTGKPKGVPNVHEGIVNRLLWMQDMYKLTGEDRVLQKTPYSFDVSVWEFFWPLMTGATLVVARPNGHKDPAYLLELIAEQEITTIHFVPSMLSIFLEAEGVERCRCLRRVFASGEALPFDLQERFFAKVNVELHNLYGPTEAAVDVTYFACRADSKVKIVPIGQPIANMQIYILNAELQPVAAGAEGELHIGGIGLARGYLNRPELTAEKFIPNPFSREPGARLYKTGDLARFLPDGKIEYLGRIDYQVKLRGFRIELGEIEAVMAECDGVRQAVVVVREDAPGDKRLVGYLAAEVGRQIAADSVKAHLRKKLPEYMVPAKFVVLEKFPLTSSGKIDRKALPAAATLQASSLAIAPRNELETRLASIFARTLRLESVGVTDDFFDLGGHSLLAARLVVQLEEIAGREIPVSALFNAPTVESLAQFISQAPSLGRDPVVLCIQRGISQLPLFAIVPPGEESLGYAILARHMGAGQTVYKIQGHAPIVGKRPYSEQEMQELAVEYAAAIRSVQPDGPYCLCGLCDGTHIAERTILQLESQGCEVGLFAIIDTWPLQNSQRPWLWRLAYFQERAKEISKMGLAEQFRRYKKAAGNRVRKLAGAAPRTEWQQAYWPENYTLSRFRAPVALFKRSKQPYYYVKDPQMGWAARTEGGVEIHRIEFDHENLLREPHVRALGEKLAACVRAVKTGGYGSGMREARGDSAAQPTTGEVARRN